MEHQKNKRRVTSTGRLLVLTAGIRYRTVLDNHCRVISAICHTHLHQVFLLVHFHFQYKCRAFPDSFRADAANLMSSAAKADCHAATKWSDRRKCRIFGL